LKHYCRENLKTRIFDKVVAVLAVILSTVYKESAFQEQLLFYICEKRKHHASEIFITYNERISHLDEAFPIDFGTKLSLLCVCHRNKDEMAQQ
jgi:hypothetical protein